MSSSNNQDGGKAGHYPQRKQPSQRQRASSPHSMMMSMSSVHHQHQFKLNKNRSNSHSPPSSPSGRTSTGSVSASNSPNANRSRSSSSLGANDAAGSHGSGPNKNIYRRRVPSSPPITPSRSWDDGDARPPSPMNNWKLRPRQNVSTSSISTTSNSCVISHRQPRIVAELVGASAPFLPQQQHNGRSSLGSGGGLQPHHPAFYNKKHRKGKHAVNIIRKTDSTTTTSSDDDDEDDLETSSVTSAPLSSKQYWKHQRHRSTSGAASNQTRNNLIRMVQALENENLNSLQPELLSPEEQMLWDAIQLRCNDNSTVTPECSNEQSMNDSGVTDCQHQQPQQKSFSNLYQSLEKKTHIEEKSTWESRFLEIQQQAVTQQQDNSRSLQAIQRVLVDVQAERDQAVLQLQEVTNSRAGTPVVGSDNDSNHTSAGPGGDDSSIEDQQFRSNAQQQDAQIMADKITELERLLQQKNDDDVSDEKKYKANGEHRSDDGVSGNQDELASKVAQLENAKLIIASLENANGILAADMRRKLKHRDDDVTRLENESKDKQNALDRLAHELQELQTIQAATNAGKTRTEQSHQERLELSSRLEDNLAEIRAAAVVLEATQDASAASALSELLTDSANVLKQGIDVIEHGSAAGNMMCNRRSRDDPQRLRSELEEHRKLMKKLNVDLEHARADAKAYRETMERSQRKHDDEIRTLRAEIRILRQQCNTNMEVLTKKERELAVLRDSLQVDDVGYISDDDDDEEDEPNNEEVRAVTGRSNGSMLALEYGPSQASAMATLLSHGGNHSFDSNGNTGRMTPVAKSGVEEEELTSQLESVKQELTKSRTDSEKMQRKLKVEKESLSNAKLIISSLEMSNKSMMEDLRARLQDSNAAISSLLEKSLESEKINASLRSEVETLRQQHHQQQQQEQQDFGGLVRKETSINCCNEKITAFDNFADIDTVPPDEEPSYTGSSSLAIPAFTHSPNNSRSSSPLSMTETID